MDNEELLAGMTRNGALLDTILATTEKQQGQIDELIKKVTKLQADFDASKENIDFAKNGRSMLLKHKEEAAKEIQKLNDKIDEHGRRLDVLETASKEGTRDSEEGDNQVRSDMNKGFAEVRAETNKGLADIRADIASVHSDIAEIKAGTGKMAIGAWKWVIGAIATVMMSGLIGLVTVWLHG